MKNYVKLSLTESLDYLIRRYNEVVAEINNYDEDVCTVRNQAKVSISIPTHRVSPQYKEDSILLKNKISEVEKELYARFDKRLAADIMENIKEAENSIDHSLNLDSLVLYAGCDFGTVIKLPVDATESALIGGEFDIRLLYKARQQAENYYIVTISQQKIRFMQAFNRIVTQEIKNEDFPFINTHYYTTDAIKLAQDNFSENLIKEYFNTADKQMKKYIAENPLPVVLAGDIKSVVYYREQMDDDSLVIATVNGNFDETPAHDIIKDIYPSVQEYNERKQKESLLVIDRAHSENLVTTGIKEIYTEAKNGNVDTLYIGSNFSKKGICKDNKLMIDLKNKDHNNREITLDIMAKVQQNSGKVMILSDELLNDYQGILAIKRYNAAV